MARRATPSAQPAYLSHSQHERALHDPNESKFSTYVHPHHLWKKNSGNHYFFRFLRTEIFAPEKLPGNISIASAVGLFVGGIIAIRTWGDLMVPA
jgi:hypothetical protein